MRNAGNLRNLVSSSRPDKESHGDRPGTGALFTDDFQAVRQTLFVKHQDQNSKGVYAGTRKGAGPSVTIVKSRGGCRFRWLTIVSGVRPSMARWISSKERTRPR